MQRSLTATDVNFVSLQSAVFCVQCELLSENNTPRCLACGSGAVLSLSRVLGGSLRGQQTAHLIADAELDRLVRSLLYTVPQIAADEEQIDEYAVEFPAAATFSPRHRMRPRHHGPLAVPHTLINAGEIDLEPGISIIAEKAQTLTGATGAAIALRRGNEIVCRARTGRTAPDIGVRLQTDSGLSAECVRTGEVLLCHDAESNPRVDWATCRRHGRALDPGRSAAPLPADAGSFRGAVVDAPRVRQQRCSHHAVSLRNDGGDDLASFQLAAGAASGFGRVTRPNGAELRSAWTGGTPVPTQATGTSLYRHRYALHNLAEDLLGLLGFLQSGCVERTHDDAVGEDADD